jgi:hypothetical protein
MKPSVRSVHSVSQLLRPCCGLVADLLRFKSLTTNAVADVTDFQTSYTNQSLVFVDITLRNLIDASPPQLS